MSWKYVFNSTVGNAWWGNIQYIISFVKDSGYEFFTWNGIVYTKEGNQTQFKVEDLF